MHWYVFFVRTGKEEKVKQLFEKHLYSEMIIPFIPLQEIIFKLPSTIKKEERPLFPGYLFAESELCSHEFVKKVSNLVNTYCDITRLLKYSDTEFCMRESEKQILLSLSNENHCIKSSEGIIKGDRVHIKDGPLKGWESIIKKVDRHKRRAWIEIEFMGEERLVSVALDITEKIIDK